MATEMHMPDPLCLINNVEGQLVPNPQALEILSVITQPVVVVAIVGLCRTGKSYLMNRLAGKDKGFSVGSTVQSHTKGICMWCVPHPEKPNHTLILLDTEGLGDVEKSDEKNDAHIFVLAMLLSSSFVYNTMNSIDQRAIDLLHYVTELSKLLSKVATPDLLGPEDETDFVSFCPDLVWTLRDFYLTLEIDGQPITADMYLENSLRPKQGTDESLQAFNLPRVCIQKFFPKRKCFIFDTPAQKKKLAQLQTMHDDELDPDFVQQVADFSAYIFSHSKIKNLTGGMKVDGPHLKSLLLSYVDAISSGNVPCIENSVLALAQIKNSEAVQKATAHYDQQMGQKVQLPTETLQELLDLHRACEKEATEVFMKHFFQDVDEIFQKELEARLEAKKTDFCQRNLVASTNCCTALLQNIFHPLEESVRLGIYSKPGGHHLYIQKREELKIKYCQVPRKGMQAQEVLQKYLQSKQSVSDAILQRDQALTAREKEMAEQRAKAQAAQAKAQRLAEIQRQNQQMMEERERRHQEEMRQKEINRARQLAEQLAEKQRAQERQLQEEAEALRRNLENERIRLQNELIRLQNNVHHSREKCIIA